MRKHVIDVDEAFSKALLGLRTLDIKFMREYMDVQLQICQAICDEASRMHLLVQLRLREGYQGNDLTLKNLCPHMGHFVDGFAVDYLATLIKFKARFDAANVVTIRLGTHYDRGTEKVAAFVSVFVATARIRIPEWSHNW